MEPKLIFKIRTGTKAEITGICFINMKCTKVRLKVAE